MYSNYTEHASIIYLICTYISFQAFKEDRTAHVLSGELGIPKEIVLTICSARNATMIAVARFLSYGILAYLVFNEAYIEAAVLIGIRIFFLTVFPINYASVLSDTFLPNTKRWHNDINLQIYSRTIQEHLESVLRRR